MAVESSKAIAPFSCRIGHHNVDEDTGETWVSYGRDLGQGETYNEAVEICRNEATATGLEIGYYDHFYAITDGAGRIVYHAAPGHLDEIPY